MLDTDTFLTVLYVMADDFCKRQPQHRRAPGPKASLTESEVITLVIFGQWARFRSERDFYRYAQSRLRPAFPTLPRRCQFNRLTRRCYGTLAAFFRCLAGLLQGRHCLYEALALDSSGVPTRDAKRRGTPAGWPDRLTLAGATAWAGMKAFTCSFPSILRASSPASALPRPAPRTRHWPRISSPSGILPTPGCPPWGRRPWAGMWRTRASRDGSGISGGGTATAPG